MLVRGKIVVLPNTLFVQDDNINTANTEERFSELRDYSNLAKGIIDEDYEEQELLRLKGILIEGEEANVDNINVDNEEDNSGVIINSKVDFQVVV